MFQAYLSLYTRSYPLTLVKAWKRFNHAPVAYLRWYWHTHDYSEERFGVRLSRREVLLLRVIQLGILMQLVTGVYLIYLGLWQHLVGGFAFGLACIVVYPVLWAQLLIFVSVVVNVVLGLLHPKQSGKHVLCWLLERQVRDLRAKHDFKIVAVVGSVGKTSTKLAIASVLGATQRMRYQEGNYNDRLTVPLVIFGKAMPSMFNFFSWLKILISNSAQADSAYNYDFVIVELGTDGLGQLKDFAYLNPDITIVTAVAPEHMEYFGTLDAVAAEELAVSAFSKKLLINIDDTPKEYLKNLTYEGYGDRAEATHRLEGFKPLGLAGAEVSFRLNKAAVLKQQIPMLGKHGALIALAAAATAHELGIVNDDIAKGLGAIKPFAGRMQVLEGVQESHILDDSYNASPIAVKAGLDVLYSLKASQHIAILGNMNELGEYSAQAHRDIGAYCNPKHVDLVVTIGPDANKYLAASAEKAGCQVASFDSPYEAGAYVKDKLRSGAIILAEGSQNRVFAEESLKVLLKNKADEKKLVRQSSYWMSVKAKQFKPL